MTHHGRAPFRLGLAGGGTDVSPYCEMFGGAVLNATIDKYAHASILPRNDGRVVFVQEQTGLRWEGNAAESLEIDKDFILQMGIYNHIVKHFSKAPLAFELITSMDVPSGSGLGTSSTLVVAIIAAFAEWLKLPLGNYDIAQMAFRIEREELFLNGGRQDQYAATFGGFNFIEFQTNGSVIVNPLKLDRSFVNDLSFSMVLYYLKSSRASSKIIEKQQENVRKGKQEAIDATHELKKSSYNMKEALIQQNLRKVGELMHQTWGSKKNMSAHISSSKIDSIYQAAIDAGAIGGKISGAGGGGFMIFCCPDHSKAIVLQVLNTFGGKFYSYSFVNEGVERWTSK
jgi:D-glycero-alpha-D-manno-heptose-7-phosphate kinase